MVRRVVVLLGLGGLLLIGGAAFAQPDTDASGLLGAMRDAYGRLDYSTAERRAREALASFDTFSADQLVEVHTTLALILYARNEPLEAREQFEAALSLNPALDLDPLLVSPKTLEFFEGVKESMSGSGVGDRESVIRYVRVRDPRPAATVRSLVLPGWGQLYKGEPVKGWALLGLWSAATAGAVTAHVLRNDARTDYLAATDPAEITSRYDTFNAWHQRRTALALGAAAVWTYAALDALVFGGPEPQGLGLGVTADAGLTVRFRW